MDEQFALLAIHSSLKHVQSLYEMLLGDKLQGDDSYGETVGRNDILSAMGKIFARIKEIEDA